MTRAAVHVGLGDRAYDVLIGPGLIDGAGGLIAPLLKRRRVAVVTDSIVGDYHGERLAVALEKGGVAVDTITVPAGEESKSFAGLESLSAQLLALKLDRGDLIVAFGGGVVGDLAGLAAAIYKRGIDFIQIPTTLLAQVDSSVGGKTAIDTPAGKNLIGAFHQPRLVLADSDVLKTLPPREMRAGYAEVAKYGLISDAAFFAWLEANGAAVLAGNSGALVHAIAVSCRSKAEIVAEDEREAGRRALLNFGHTFGHALEAECGYNDTLLHGESVSIGMVLAFRLSARLGLCPPEDAARVAHHLTSLGLPTALPTAPRSVRDPARLLDHMRQDKKVRDGKLTFVLTRGIGKAFIADDVPLEAVTAILDEAAAA